MFTWRVSVREHGYGTNDCARLAISAQRAPPASAKINATIAGARQKGSWRRCPVVAARSGDAPPSLLAIRPSVSTRDPLQYFNSLLALWRLGVRLTGFPA